MNEITINEFLIGPTTEIISDNKNSNCVNKRTTEKLEKLNFLNFIHMSCSLQFKNINICCWFFSISDKKEEKYINNLLHVQQSPTLKTNCKAQNTSIRKEKQSNLTHGI